MKNINIKFVAGLAMVTIGLIMGVRLLFFTGPLAGEYSHLLHDGGSLFRPRFIREVILIMVFIAIAFGFALVVGRRTMPITRIIKVLSWLSFAAPFIAVMLCIIEGSMDTWWPDAWWPEDSFPYARICFTWDYAFLASGFIGLLALIGSLTIKEKLCILRSVAGLVLSFLFAAITVFLTYIS